MDKKIKRNIENSIVLNSIIPKNKSLFGFFLLIKVIPLFVVTHDWNISSKKGISFWIRKFTLSEFFNSASIYYFYISIVILLFLMFIYVHVIQTILLFHKIKVIHNKIYGFIIFFVYYGLNQYIYSIFIEILFNEKKNELSDLIYYTLLAIIIILVFTLFYLNIILCTLIINEPIFLQNQSFLINPLNQIDYKTTVLSIGQIFIQLEFHLKFNNMMIVKNIARGLYCVFYLKEMITFNKYYNRFYIEYFQKFYHSCCFISCIIEWIFYYDYNNNLMILQKDIGIIVLKLIIEINLSFAFCGIYYHFDNKILEKKILNFNSKNTKSFDYNLIKLFNMIYFGDRPKFLRKILMKLNRVLEKSIHHPKCKDTNCYYCYEYSFSEFNFQMDNFLKKKDYIKQIIL